MNEAKQNTCCNGAGDCDLSRAGENSTGTARSWLFGMADEASPSNLPTACRAAVGAGFAGIDYAVTALPQELDGNAAASQARETTGEGTEACGLHAVTMVTTLGRLVETQQAVKSWLGRNSGDRARWLTWFLTSEDALSGSESPAAGTDSEIGNRLYNVLSELRFDFEASGVSLAIDAGGIRPHFGAVALREVIDAVSSSAIGTCVRIEFGGAQEDPAKSLSLLDYRVKVVRICIDGATTGNTSGMEVILQIAPAFRQALAAVRSHSAIIVEGGPDPLATRAAVESLWVP